MKRFLLIAAISFSFSAFAQDPYKDLTAQQLDKLAVTHNHGQSLVDDPDANPYAGLTPEQIEQLAVTHNHGQSLVDDPDADLSFEAGEQAELEACLADVQCFEALRATARKEQSEDSREGEFDFELPKKSQQVSAVSN